MKKIIIFLAAIAGLTSCTFFSANTERGTRLGDLMRRDFGVDVPGESVKASRNIETRTLQIPEFKAVDVQMPCTLTYVQASPEAVLTGPDNVLDNMKFEVVNDTLFVHFDKVHFRNLKNLEVKVSSSVLNSLSSKGAAEFKLPQGISVDSFSADMKGSAELDVFSITANTINIHIKGAADVAINGIEAAELAVNIQGAGDCVFKGHAGIADFSIHGAGNIDATNLKVEDKKVSIHGAGGVEWK